jgi:LacI family transcriptional regulator
VSEATRQKVLAAVAETGYTPDAVARALRSARTMTVGLVVPDIRNPFFAAVIEGVELEARASGQTLLFANSGEDPDREVTAIGALRAQRVDGLIVGLTRRTPADILRELHESPTPVVLVDRAGPPGFDQVTVANEVGAEIAVRHLAEIGHRRIGLVAGVRGISPVEDRIAGYRAGLEAAGLPFDASLVIDGGSRRELAHLAVTTDRRRSSSATTT